MTIFTTRTGVPFLEATFIAFRFVFGNAHANKTAGKATGGRTDRRSAEQGQERSSRDERSDARNGQGPQSGKQADHAAHAGTGQAASYRTLWRFAGLLVAKWMRIYSIGKNH